MGCSPRGHKELDMMEKVTATNSSILAWRICLDRGAWWDTLHGVAKSQA